jgi:hypothetical protein
MALGGEAVIPAKLALNLSLDVETNRPTQDPITLRAYLKELLLTVWDEEEGFSGKRPFGNSGWQHDLAGALIRAGVDDIGRVDGDGWIEKLDGPAFQKLMHEAMEAL